MTPDKKKHEIIFTFEPKSKNDDVVLMDMLKDPDDDGNYSIKYKTNEYLTSSYILK